MKNLTSITLASMILASACTKTEKEVQVKYVDHNSIQNDKNELKLDDVVKNELNFVTLDLINTVLAETKLKNQLELDPEEIKNIREEILKRQKTVRNMYLQRGESYQENSNLIRGSILNREMNGMNKFSQSDVVTVEVLGSLKSKYLNSIIQSYSQESDRIARVLAQDVAKFILQNEPQKAEYIEELLKNNRSKEEIISAIQNLQSVLSKADEAFKNSSLSQDEQVTVLIGALVAGGVYQLLKEKETFKRIVSESQKVVQDAKEIYQKYKELALYSKVLKKHFEETGTNFRELKNNMQHISGAIMEFKDEVKDAKKYGNESKVKDINHFLFETVIQGKKSPTENQSILSRKVVINENLSAAVDTVGKLSNNLTNIIETTQALSSVLGVKPSSEFNKILSKAAKVGAAVQTAQAVIRGFATGGVLGALGGLSSGPLAGLTGGGDSQMRGELSAINQKLDMVLENQRIMMKAQLETMKMIKDLALMLNEFHDEEMMALSELRDLSLVNKELLLLEKNSRLSACEDMVNYSLYNSTSRQMKKISVDDYLTKKSLLERSINTQEDIQKLVSSITSLTFSDCQNSMNEAFNLRDGDENFARNIFSMNNEENLLKFEQEMYVPAKNLLLNYAGTSELGSIPLHIPTQSLSDIPTNKTMYVMKAQDNVSRSFNFDLDTLFSTKIIERYVLNLLTVYPYLKLDKEEWMQGKKTLIENLVHSDNNREKFLLERALNLVQTAIAQESLLAGESILDLVFTNHQMELFSNDICSSDVCLLRKNKLLMKNMMNFIFKTKGGIVESLDNNKKIDSIIYLLGGKLKKDNFEVVTNGAVTDIYLKLPISSKETLKIKLPLRAELLKSEVIYSENMPKLVELQELVLKELAKVTNLESVEDKLEYLNFLNAASF